MKLEKTEGCVCWSYTVDDTEFVDLTLEQQKEVLIKMINSTRDCGNLQDLFSRFLELEGDFEDLGTCEECGDSIFKHTLEIND